MEIGSIISDKEIREQLSRILTFPAFTNSRILTKFLGFVVEETLSGREYEIKEYTIGVHVLARKIDFNPQLDAIVRIHAGRLRRSLKEYYYEVGKDDSLLIEIPKGSYIPVFQLKAKSAEAPENGKAYIPSKAKPVVAILPFRNISHDPSRDYFADGLGEQLCSELTWFHDLSVIAYYSSRHVTTLTRDLKETATLLGAKYLLTGSIQNDDTHLRVSVQLIYGDTGEQLWAKTYEQNNTASNLFDIQNEIVRNTLTAIGGYYGAIFRDVLKTNYSDRSNELKTYDAVFWYYHFQKVWTHDVLVKTISALQEAVKADPDYALAWAMLGELYIDDKVLEFKMENPLEEGLKCIQRAISLDPNCQHAYQALAWASLFLHKKEDCINAVEKCIAINPNAADKTGAMGFALTCAGEFEQGYELMNDSVRQNPYFPWWFNTTYVFYFLQKQDYENANKWAEKIDKSDVFWDPLLKTTTLGHLNRKSEAVKHLQLLNQLIPDARNKAKSIIESFLLSNVLTNEILKGLKKAGL